MRTHLKRALEHSLLACGADRFARWRRRGDVLILAYHNIVPHGESPVGDRPIHLAQARFAEQLDLLMDTLDLVPLSAVVDSPRADATRPRAVITFDDAYQGAVTAGIEELARRRVPATIFIAPAYIGGEAFWWDTLADPELGLSPRVREHALGPLQGRQTRILEWAAAEGLPVHDPPAHATGATEAQLRAALEHPFVEGGSHTWSHPNLAMLSPSDVQEELDRAHRWLADHIDPVTPFVTYPYGASSSAVERAVAAIGYTAGLRIDGGWIGDGANTYALPRLNVGSGLSSAGFALRVAGVFPRLLR